MRVSTNLSQQMAINAMLEQQSALTKTQLQLASGKRILSASDDPAGTSAVLSLRQNLGTTEQLQSNADLAVARLEVQETALTSSMNVLQNARELALQGNNDSQTPESRRILANEVRLLLDELLSIANSKDNNNDYMFSGHQVNKTPFTKQPGNTYAYQGDGGQRFIKIGTGREMAVTDSGQDVFMEIRNGNGTFVTAANANNTGTGNINTGSVSGTYVPDANLNGYEIQFIQALPTDPITYQVVDDGGAGAVVTSGTYTSGNSISFNGAVVNVEGTPANGDRFTVNISRNQSVFQTLENLAAELEGTSANISLLHNNMAGAIRDIDQAMDNIESFRAQIGSRLNGIENQKSINESVILQLKSSISSIEDLDFAEAVSRLNINMVGLEAAQQSYTRIQGLSLFNFL
jgi:flagellar hook-associated protein 3 FlgL